MKIVKQKISKNLKSYKATKKCIRWHQDPKGYFLIRVGKKSGAIEAAFCTNNHVITKMFSGKAPTELYYKISQEIKGLRPEHYSYLGKELYKAWLCLKYRLDYVQDNEMPAAKVRITKEKEINKQQK
ncbi:MAG: hypothetical protein V1659_05955 [Candidatus Woesearchaeota archaeon]